MIQQGHVGAAPLLGRDAWVMSHLLALPADSLSARESFPRLRDS